MTAHYAGSTGDDHALSKRHIRELLVVYPDLKLLAAILHYLYGLSESGRVA